MRISCKDRILLQCDKIKCQDCNYTGILTDSGELLPECRKCVVKTCTLCNTYHATRETHRVVELLKSHYNAESVKFFYVKDSPVPCTITIFGKEGVITGSSEMSFTKALLSITESW